MGQKVTKWKNMSDGEMKRIYYRDFKRLDRGALQKKKRNFYEALRRKNLIYIVPGNDRNDWDSKSNDELIELLRTDFKGASKSDICYNFPGLYKRLGERKLLKYVLKDGRKGRDWKSKTDEYVIKYYYKKYEGLGRNELEQEDPSFYNQLNERNLLYIIPPKKEINTEKREWKSKTDKEVVDYYKENHDGVMRGELSKKDKGLYDVMRKRGLLEHIFSKRKEPGFWDSRTNEEIIKIYTEYGSLSIKQLREQRLQSLYKQLLKRDLTYFIPNSTNLIRSPKRFRSFVKNNEVTQKIIGLGMTDNNGYMIDAIEVLAKLYPDRIDANKTLKIIDDNIESLGPYLGRFRFDRRNWFSYDDMVEGLPEKVFEMEAFDRLLYNISRDSYMKKFNRNPTAVIKKLDYQKSRTQNEYVTKLLTKVQSYYKDILELEIPGVPKLAAS